MALNLKAPSLCSRAAPIVFPICFPFLLLYSPARVASSPPFLFPFSTHTPCAKPWCLCPGWGSSVMAKTFFPPPISYVRVLFPKQCQRWSEAGAVFCCLWHTLTQRCAGSGRCRHQDVFSTMDPSGCQSQEDCSPQPSSVRAFLGELWESGGGNGEQEDLFILPRNLKPLRRRGGCEHLAREHRRREGAGTQAHIDARDHVHWDKTVSLNISLSNKTWYFPNRLPGDACFVSPAGAVRVPGLGWPGGCSCRE